jgi:L-seryl-tRNA(Ser) seleniumtransferase
VVSGLAASGLHATIIPGTSTIGGGSAPGSAIPTRLIALTHNSLTASQIEQRLRKAEPPIVARIEQDRVMLDLRTVLAEQDQAVVKALAAF